MKNQWLIKPRPVQNADIKLLCFPYAGGGASVYFPWKDKLPSNVELNIVQLPGRGTHFSKNPIDDMTALVRALLPQVADIFQGNYMVYGHSMGSRVAFELVRQAVARGFAAPEHFFASGSTSPKRKCFERKIFELPDDEFKKEIKEMNGTPQEVLESDELMNLLLPTLRADFKIAETYTCHDNFTLPTNVTVLSGKEDTVSQEQLALWGDFFMSSEVVMCDGGHFFIDSHTEQVLEIVNQRLSPKRAVA